MNSTMASLSSFTFHYVSIKSLLQYKAIPTTVVFTFHYVSIKSITHKSTYRKNRYLHSTMYLLNPGELGSSHTIYANLHSTMYLLNPDAIISNHIRLIFTFHYVSIKSEYRFNNHLSAKEFTFHYVSIKSVFPYSPCFDF